MPIWSQALVIVLLSCIFMATVGWIWKENQTPLPGRSAGAIEAAVRDIIFLAMPISLLYLGMRFFMESIRSDISHWVSAAICLAALIFLLPALLAIGYWSLPAPQRVREGSIAAFMQDLVARNPDRSV
jgi:hypothetical protein